MSRCSSDRAVFEMLIKVMARAWCSADDVAGVTAAQVRRVVVDLVEMGRRHPGDRDILIVCGAGYDAPRMAHLLAGLSVKVLVRMRTDRVMRKPAWDRIHLRLTTRSAWTGHTGEAQPCVPASSAARPSASSARQHR